MTYDPQQRRAALYHKDDPVRVQIGKTWHYGTLKEEPTWNGYQWIYRVPLQSGFTLPAVQEQDVRLDPQRAPAARLRGLPDPDMTPPEAA